MVSSILSLGILPHDFFFMHYCLLETKFFPAETNHHENGRVGLLPLWRAFLVDTPLWHTFLVDTLLVLAMELLEKNKCLSMDVDFDFLLRGPG